MTRQQDNRRRAADALAHLSLIATPLLLAMVIYFVKPIFDIVPVLSQNLAVMKSEQAAITETVKTIEPKVENAITKIEVLDSKISRIEKKLD